MKTHFKVQIIYFCILIFQVPLAHNQKCVKLNHNSEEFRISAGAYEVEENMEPIDCQGLCKASNYSYAAVMANRFCLCSDTNYDYPEIEDEKCCRTEKVDCGDDPDMVLAMQVEDDPDIAVELQTEIVEEGVGNIRKTVLVYRVSMKLNVEAELRLLYDDNDIKDPFTFFGPEAEDIFHFTNVAIPGRHVAKAVAVDVGTGAVSSFDEHEILIPDGKVSLDLDCPDSIETGETAVCNVTVFRGTDLDIEVQFGDSDPQVYTVPDAAVQSVGLTIPQVFHPSGTPSLPPEVVYLSLGDLPISILVGFEYFATLPGQFEIQILSPKCGEGTAYCGSCQSSCQERGIYSCSEGTEALCSVKRTCAAVSDPPMCRDTTSKTEDLVLVKSLEVTVQPPTGYIYYAVEENEQVKLEPGYVLALNRIRDPVVMFTDASGDEKEAGLDDRDEDGNYLGVRHLIRPVVVEPYNISFSHNFTKSGKFKVRAVLTSRQEDDDSQPGTIRTKRAAPAKIVLQDEKEATIRVTTMLSGLQLSGPANCTDMGKEASLEATLENGDNFTFTWIVDTFEKRSYIYEAAPLTTIEKYTCQSERNFTVSLDATDGVYSENGTALFCCRNHISRNWMLETDSPQIAPPGEINIQFHYTGNVTYFPLGAMADFEFGDGQIEYGIVIADYASKIVKSHVYELDGEYNITVQVYNEYENEVFVTKVILLEKLGILDVVVKYMMEDENDLKDGHGQEKRDVPLNSIVNFMCNVSGAVENYTMELENENIIQDNPDNIFTHQFSNVGEYTATFVASNFLEQSNNVSVLLRVMTKATGLGLRADPTSLMPHDEVVFDIEFEYLDPFTCLTFDAADDEVIEAFGNEDTCRQIVKEEIRYHPKTSDRRRRETQEVTWVDDSHIRLRYIYHGAGTFHPIAKAFNTIFQTNATAELDVAFPPSNIWIENNSTNIKRPMRYLREETFRLETTALLFDHPSRSYYMSWRVEQIDPSDKVIDVSAIRSSNCSALRIPVRYLEVGLYKVQYFIDVYGNDTLEETATCFTYLEIMSSPLKPMIIKGGASYILRGYDQMVYLEAEKYSIDPDEPEDKGFKIEWSCQSFDPNELLPDGENYDDIVSLSNVAVTLQHTDQLNSNAKCFKGSKDSKVLKGDNLSFNTKDLINFNVLYMFQVSVSKDSRRQKAYIYLDVIQSIPPGLIIKCEKPTACIVTEEGFLVNPNSWLAVRAECITECGNGNIKYKWEIYGIDETSHDRIDLDDWRDYVIVDEDRLGVNKSFFKAHQEFQSFHLHVTGIDGVRPRGSAKLYVRLNKPPMPGTCKLSRNTGLATITIFTLEFDGWSDPERHPLRDFSVYNIYKGKRFHIHYGVKTSVEFILPPGKSEIICAVQDQQGAVTTIPVDIVEATMPDNETLELWKEDVNIDFFVVEGKLALLSQALTSEAFVDEIQREMNYVSGR